MSSLDFSQLFAQQKKHAQTLRLENVRERKRRLRALRGAIQQHEAEITAALAADFCKAGVESELTEIGFVLKELDFIHARVEDWARPRPVETPLGLLGTESWLRFEPRGTSLIMAPWNYPFQLLFTPLLGALAAGCTAVLKPSELAPRTAAVSRKVVESAFGATGKNADVAVVEGAADVAQALLALPFDHIFFTGSPAVGRSVMGAAAKNLSSVTLELGGKSPVILCDDADLDLAAARVAWGKFMNAGQTCVAPDYVLLPQAREREFISKLMKQIAHNYGADENARQRSGDFARIINERHFQRVKGLVEQALAGGARAECGARFDVATRYVAPTVLSGVNAGNAIMQEEIFGPVLPVLTYEKLAEAMNFVIERPKPLALYVFTSDMDKAETVLAHCTSGGACVNQVILQLVNPELPFGGVGNSGQGSTNGYYAFRSFSHERAVLRQGSPDLLKMFYAPYSTGKLKLARLLRKL